MQFSRIVTALVIFAVLLFAFKALAPASRSGSSSPDSAPASIKGEGTATGQSYYHQCLRAVDWTSLKESLTTKKDDAVYVQTVKTVLDVSVQFLLIAPVAPVNAQCKPPVFVPDCAKYPNVFQKQREKPVKMAHMIQLGFDADALEMHLHELYDVVDKFIIIESTLSHFKGITKPLIWSLLATTARFRMFRDKVVHFVIDDSEGVANPDKGQGIWALERYTESARFKKFISWNNEHKFFTNEDVLGFGDADEISSRRNALLLKNCAFKASSIDAGILYIEGFLEQRVKTDFPVSGHPFHLGDPSFFTLENAIKHGSPSRMRGGSPEFVLGGMHLTHYGYIPFQLIKRITCTECGFHDIKAINYFIELLDSPTMNRLEDVMAKTAINDIFRNHDHLMDVMPLDTELPWFLKCNPDRYPRWFGKHDPRLDLTQNQVNFVC